MSDSNQELFTIANRAYTEPVQRPSVNRGFYANDPGASQWSLVFDTETTVDARQALRFGFFQLRFGLALDRKGVFYEPGELSESEVQTLIDFSKDQGLECMTSEEFRERLFLGAAYDFGASYIGFNLPFDLSRLAVGHSDAKPSRGSSAMVGGFSFRFSEDSTKPKVQVKHLSSRSALIRFTLPFMGQTRSGGMARRNVHSSDYRGHFLDVRSFAAAILSGSWSLKSLADHLGTEHRKLDTEDHGQLLTADYLRYAYQDVQTTWECYVELAKRYRALELSTKPERIISEASLGKAYLDQMGVQPWTRSQPDFPRKYMGAAMSSYYGGRSEVHVRRIPVRVMYCDFLSMYPTVCVLMYLWRHVIASSICCKDATEWTRDFLEGITIESLQDPATWRRLTVLVKVLPDEDILPVRARYDGMNRSIGLNKLSSDKPLWFTLADCITSKLLTGRTPTVVEAVAFKPGEPQDRLQPVQIAGNPDYLVRPLQDDFFKRVIELRSSVKDRLKSASGDEVARLESEQQALKICANATSYGIFAELNPNQHSRPVDQLCYGGDEPFQVATTSVEQPGKFFNPMLASFITGAARLMLALCEKIGADNGLTWAFCDTDGIGLTPAEDMCEVKLSKAVSRVREWFKALSPYEGNPDLLKLEDENFKIIDGRASNEIEPLYCFAVSAKRYALFNREADGSIILRKATAHGLGHLMAPFEDDAEPRVQSVSAIDLRKAGLRRWQVDLWHCIVESGLSDKPEQVNLTSMQGLDKPAVSRYAATTPDLLRWFERFNDGKPYSEQVRPFGFMHSYQSRQELGAREAPKASAPFHPDPVEGAKECFDRDTGEAVPFDQLKAIGEALIHFHLHPEMKFKGGDYTDRGMTARRNIRVVGVEHIGKEANRWEDSVAVGEALTEELDYGEDPQHEADHLEAVFAECRLSKKKLLALHAGISPRELSRILNGEVKPPRETMRKLETAITIIRNQRVNHRARTD